MTTAAKTPNIRSCGATFGIGAGLQARNTPANESRAVSPAISLMSPRAVLGCPGCSPRVCIAIFIPGTPETAEERLVSDGMKEKKLFPSFRRTERRQVRRI